VKNGHAPRDGLSQMAYHQGKLVQTKARPISTIKPSACEKWSCSKKWLVRCHQLLCCGSHSNVVGMTTGPHAKTHPTKFRYVHTSHPCTHTHTSYILLHHVTQRHGNCLSSSVINYLTRIASDHKWYKWSSQKQLIIRSEMSASCLVDGEGIACRSHKHETEKLRNQ
jgi:hypothetical protein